MSKHSALIGALSEELTPVRPGWNVNVQAILWLLFSALFVVAVTFLAGPIRSNALEQLVSEPHFLAETLLGVVAIVVTAVVAFRSAIPGALDRRLLLLGLGLVALWLSCYVLGFFNPALEPSMLGKRDHCVFESFLYGLVPMAIAWYLSRRFYPLQPVSTALLYGLAAGQIPALYMQLACMYEPAHILSFHIAPGLAVLPVAALLVKVVRFK